MDCGGLQHTVPISSLKAGTEIPKEKRKKIPVLFLVMKVISWCHQSQWSPLGGSWIAGGGPGSPQPHASVESKQWAWRWKVFAPAWGGPAFFLCCGKEDHWEDSKEDEVVCGGRCGFSAHLRNLFQQEIKATQIRCWLPHWHCPGLQLLHLRLRADLKRTQKIKHEKNPTHENQSCLYCSCHDLNLEFTV